ncbi:MAG: molybdopterin-binding protein [Gammaproteobacteria bacterium]|nr:molybdopterin-binding protein [Gammaproteobacteria bacterium]MCY4228037.1 molybdopterin-binding protein [Gammaproteobacteria bacterium]
MKIGILCTGDEILTGKTVNTNYSHIARRLFEYGFEVNWGAVVGDQREAIHQAMEFAASLSDAVIVNGGLGPTVDDLTQEVAAKVAKVELELNQEWLDHIAGWYRSRGRVMPDNNQKQAFLPAGSELMDNPIGTACGFALDINRVRFFFTPGVPRELHMMLEQEVLPRLQSLRGISLHTHIKRFHSFGIGESRADKMLAKAAQMAESSQIKLGFQSHYPQLETKLVANATTRDVPEMMGPIEGEIRDCLGSFIVSEDDQTLEGNICRILQESGTSVSIVEMHTAGLINSRLHACKEQGDLVKVGVVSQTMGDLHELFKLPNGEQTLPAAAERVAVLASQQNKSTYGLAVLTERYFVGREQGGIDIHLGIVKNGNVQYRKSRMPGSPNWTRLGAVELGLDFLRRSLAGLSVHELIDFEQH